MNFNEVSYYVDLRFGDDFIREYGTVHFESCDDAIEWRSRQPDPSSYSYPIRSYTVDE